MAGHHGQANEALVFPHHLPGEDVAPALLPREPAGEWQLGLRIIRLEGFDPL